jgi:hypothetical protein
MWRKGSRFPLGKDEDSDVHGWTSAAKAMEGRERRNAVAKYGINGVLKAGVVCGLE